MDKPSGWTSHDVVAVARRVLGTRRIGHGGTLDPLATGLLPLLVGPATKAAELLHGAPKAYAAVVRFGHETPTDDLEGAPTRKAPVPAADVEWLDQQLAPFRGTITQVPPAFAAVKVGGRAAYVRARAGETTVLRPREVTVERVSIASWRPPDLVVLVVCGRGTYIRALARDIGRAVGSAAHLALLRRLAVGALDAGVAISVDIMRARGRDAVLTGLLPADPDIAVLDDRYRSEPVERLLGDWGQRP
ncbi:MAG: tRNA pseudouridine(55) synthase TruB [Chloroflexota bacterium]|nr:tRNA pseudouridine(55) synthase TruB [Chloroflexota bacterium]